MKLLRVRGRKRAVLDLTSEATTLGAGGGGDARRSPFRPSGRRATTGSRPRSSRSPSSTATARKSVAAASATTIRTSSRIPRPPDQGGARDRGPALLRALGHRSDRHLPRADGQRPRRRRRAGRLLDHPAARQEPLPLINERSLERKIKEAFLAVWLEFHLTKDEILKLYLDRAYMGGGAFGAVAAADYYFGKSVKDLTLAESAMLAGLFKAPTKYAPHVNLPAARARANDVLTNMVEAGFLTEGQIQTARRNPATPIDRKRDTTPGLLPRLGLRAGQGARRRRQARQRARAHRQDAARSGIQRKAEQALENILRQYGSQYEVEQAAMVVMDPDGAVRAMVGGRDYGQSQFNRATDALRQPGSSFKPFVYAAALTAGLPARTPS